MKILTGMIFSLVFATSAFGQTFSDDVPDDFQNHIKVALQIAKHKNAIEWNIDSQPVMLSNQYLVYSFAAAIDGKDVFIRRATPRDTGSNKIDVVGDTVALVLEDRKIYVDVKTKRVDMFPYLN